MNRILTLICLLAAGVGSVSAAARYKGDLNNDGKVDLADMVVLATAINEGKTDKTLQDLNASGSVDDADLHALANIILSEKLTEDTGLNIGIGGWEDSGEDFGGSVGAPVRRNGTSETMFYAEGPKYDMDKAMTYIDFGIQSASEDLCAILFNLRVPNDVEFEAGKYVELYGELLPGHAIYGIPVVKQDSEWEKRLRFIVFSPTLEVLGKESAPIGRLVYTTINDAWGDIVFNNSQVIAKCSTVAQNVPEHGSYIGGWNYKFINSISINPSLEMRPGENSWIEVNIDPYDASNKQLKWISSNPEVVTVEGNEVGASVTSHAVGEAVITVSATDGSGVSATCQVKVQPILVSNIYINYGSLELKPGESWQLDVAVEPWDATEKSLRWESSDTNIVTVDEKGNVSAHAPGQATITVSSTDGSGVSATCTVTVMPILVSSISLSKSEIELQEGAFFKLEVFIDPSDATNNNLQWESDNVDIVEVDQSGQITAKSVGEAMVTVSTTDGSVLSASCNVRVLPNKIAITSITIAEGESSEVFVGGTLALHANIEPGDASNKVLMWISSDTSIASVDENGNVSAYAPGQVTITVSSTDGSGVSATCTVTVMPILVSSISLSKSEIELQEGAFFKLEVFIDPSDATNNNLQWESNNVDIVEVDQSGQVTAKSVGEAMVTVSTTDGSALSASCNVRVLPNEIAITSITIAEGESSEVFVGGTLALHANIEPGDASNKVLMWTSSDTSIVSVDENGNVSAHAPGQATINVSATDGSGVSATCLIKVLPILVSSIMVEPATLELAVGNSQRLTVYINPDNATDKSVQWSSDNEAVATVDQEGTVTVLSEGSTIIRVRALDGSGLESTCLISGLSAITEIISDESPIDIYSIKGVLIMKSVHAKSIVDLAAGVYIIRQGDKTYKILK